MIVDSGNHYLAALKGNQPTLYRTVRQQFTPHQSVCTLNKGHGRIEKRTVSICPFNSFLAGWNSITTAIRVESQRITRYKHETYKKQQKTLLVVFAVIGESRIKFTIVKM